MHRPSHARSWIDHNGRLTERRVIAGQEVIIHYDDLPPSDITSIDGIRCTTALRTVLDLAADVSNEQLHRMIRDCLRRQLFTVEEALERANRRDLRDRVGTQLFLEALLGYVPQVPESEPRDPSGGAQSRAQGRQISQDGEL